MDTAPFAAKLKEEQQQLEREMGRIARPNPAIPGDWEPLPSEAGFEPDPVDQAELVTNREDTAAVLADLEARYAAVTAALGRIEAGTYGACSICGNPIEEARLAADPAAATCAPHR
jgi:RNA polymerase-binding transcription factor DksA